MDKGVDAKAKRGRPSAYNPDVHPTWAWMLAAVEEMTIAQIAQAMHVTESTIYLWQDKYPEFSEALKSGKGGTDANVVRNLYQRATGYDYTERKIISKGKGKDGKPIIDRVEETRKHVPPDVGAICFWLKNRAPDKWRDKPIDEGENDALLRAAEILAGVKFGTDTKAD